MRAASGAKSIKDSKLGPWTEGAGQGYWQQLAEKERYQICLKIRLNLFALRFTSLHPLPLWLTYILVFSSYVPKLSLSSFQLLHFSLLL